MDILLIEDNPDISLMICRFLKKDGFSYHTVKSGEEGLDFIKNNEVKIVLLDLMLPNMDGFQVCKKIHKEKNLPLIILSAKTDKDDKLNGFTLGADDYIEKPFDIDILLAKIHSLYRRHYENETEINFKDMKIDTEARTVLFKEKPLDLNVKEFDLLVFLAKNCGKALRKENIFDSVWGQDSFSEPSTLTVHINRLRERIESDPKEPKYIRTVWGVGYKFEAEHE